MQVKDFMIRNVISAHPDTPIKKVMGIFVEKKIGGVPIMDDDGKLRGIVTDGDILRSIKPIDHQFQNYFTYSIYLEERNLESRVSDMADEPVIRIAKTRDLVTVSPDDDMKKVIQILAKHHFKKLPVVDKENRVVGVISRGDAIRNIQMTILNEWT